MMGVEEVKTNLHAAIEEALSNENPDNPIYRVRESKIMREVAHQSPQEFLIEKIESIERRMDSLITRGSVEMERTGQLRVKRNHYRSTPTVSLYEIEVKDSMDEVEALAARLVEKVNPHDYEIGRGSEKGTYIISLLAERGAASLIEPILEESDTEVINKRIGSGIQDAPIIQDAPF
jgi:hypothetical protein